VRSALATIQKDLRKQPRNTTLKCYHLIGFHRNSYKSSIHAMGQVLYPSRPWDLKQTFPTQKSHMATIDRPAEPYANTLARLCIVNQVTIFVDGYNLTQTSVTSPLWLKFIRGRLLLFFLRSNAYGEAIAGDTKGSAERREVGFELMGRNGRVIVHGEVRQIEVLGLDIPRDGKRLFH
jgi:hypothetical protein